MDHQIMAYLYIGLTIIQIFTAIGIIRWVRKEREKMFRDVNQLICNAFGGSDRKIKFFKVAKKKRSLAEILDEIPVATEEVFDPALKGDDECPEEIDHPVVPDVSATES